MKKSKSRWGSFSIYSKNRSVFSRSWSDDYEPRTGADSFTAASFASASFAVASFAAASRAALAAAVRAPRPESRLNCAHFVEQRFVTDAQHVRGILAAPIRFLERVGDRFHFRFIFQAAHQRF